MPTRSLLYLTTLLFLVSCAQPLRKRHLLVIGDSNGYVPEGWVTQLQDIRGGGPLVNTSLAGNTIGFTDAGDLSRNTLENLTSYLRRGYAEMGSIDEILIALGTNDCKTRFADRHDRIDDNLAELLRRTRAFFTERGQELPRIVLITPPPLADDDDLIDEFRGAKQCAADFSEQLRAIATREGYCLVDLQRQPGDRVLAHSSDGIHFDVQGYKMLARAVVNSCY